ncbi:MAG: ABC transporter permease [Actinomycetota bacterium]
MALSLIQGRVPAAPGEIALGSKTMAGLRVHLGSTVSVDAGGGPRPFRVVGRVTLPLFPDATGEGSGAAISFDALAAGACPPGAPPASCAPAEDTILIGVTSGRTGAAARANVSTELGGDLLLPQEPIDLFNFGQALDLPLLLGIVVAIFGAATLTHLLLVSLSRRRSEMAVLKSLGFVQGQVAGAVLWQAGAAAVVAVAVGIPLGVAAGRVAWQLFASQAGVVPSAVVPLPAVALIAGGSIAVALVVALLPAWLAARTVTPAALRSL